MHALLYKLRRQCGSPTGFVQCKWGNDTQHGGKGARTPPAAHVCGELREAIRPNNLTCSPNCFLLLPRNHTAVLALGEISAYYEAMGNSCITAKCWLFVSTDPISVNQWTTCIPPPALVLPLPSKLRAGLLPPLTPRVLVLRMPRQQGGLEVAQSH